MDEVKRRGGRHEGWSRRKAIELVVLSSELARLSRLQLLCSVICQQQSHILDTTMRTRRASSTTASVPYILHWSPKRSLHQRYRSLSRSHRRPASDLGVSHPRFSPNIQFNPYSSRLLVPNYPPETMPPILLLIAFLDSEIPIPTLRLGRVLSRLGFDRSKISVSIW